MKINGYREGEYQYLDLLQDILENGHEKKEFNSGISLKSVFGRQCRYDLSKGFPLLTTKKLFLRGIIEELLWFLQGDSNIKYLVDRNVHIWDEWAYKRFCEAKIRNSKFEIRNSEQKKKKTGKIMSQEEFIEKIRTNSKFARRWGELGPIYGRQWRKWETSDGRVIDQIAWAVNKLKKTPTRKHIMIAAWNPEFVYEMAASREKSVVLPPCHSFFQINVNDKNELSLQLYQRSSDVFLGVPFNIASYALLTMMFSHIGGFKPGEFVHTFGDVHIYGNHMDQVKEQLKRKPRPFPTMKINRKVKSIDDFKIEDFTLENYNPYPPIKAEVTVVGGF
jgi:thymidylate synthase